MDHAEVRERLADLALEPARLWGLEDDGSPDGVALREHLDACEACHAELVAIRRTDGALRDALAAGEEAEPPAALRAPPGLRASVLDASAIRRSPRPRLPLALAAALVLALTSGGFLLQRSAQLDVASTELAGLSSATAALDRILADPDHRVVTLRAADGMAGGTVAWDGSEVVVLATSLTRPTDGRIYRCWVEEGGDRSGVGTMWFSGSTAYWAGTLDEWGAALGPGSRFGVSLIQPAGGGEPLPVLVGDL